MSKKNFTISTVATAPSPATTGTSLVVASGHGARFAINEPAIVFPTGEQPDSANAEIVTVSNVATDTLTIVREQENTTARTIVVGDIIIQGITAKDWNDLVTLVAGKITAFADPNADRIVFWDDSAGAFVALTASTGLTLTGTNLTVRTSSATQTGIVELATTAETETGTDATRAVTPDGLHDMTTLAGASWFLDEDSMASNSAVKTASQQSIKAYVDSTKFTWKGAWTTSTVYAVNDTVQNNGSGYVCTTAHTSGTFATDLSAGKWDLFVEGTNKTMPTGDIVGTTDTQTLTNKTLTSPLFGGTIDGWISAGETWTYASADDPTFTFTVAADVTTKYSVGMKIKLTQTTVKYFIITAVSAYSGGNTTITVYGGTDYDLANAAISANYYSMVRSPFGFPMSPKKWTVVTKYTTDNVVSPSTGDTKYNVTNIVAPIGLWRASYLSSLGTSVAGTEITAKLTLSTANNSESDTEMTTMIKTRYSGGTAVQEGDVTVFAKKILEVVSKTTYYLNMWSVETGNVFVRASTYHPTRIEFECAYL